MTFYYFPKAVGRMVDQHLYLNGRVVQNSYLPFLDTRDMELIDLLLRKADKLEEQLERQREDLQEIKSRLDTLDTERVARGKVWGKVWALVSMILIFLGWIWEQVRLWFLR